MARRQDEDADEIIPGVWIGRWQPALNGEWLAKHEIKAVFNCTKQLDFHPAVPYQYRIPVDDNLQPAEINNMEAWAPEIAYKMMREYKAGHPMLIHCHAGMQRSTTACAFFLMVLTGKPLIHVMRHIKGKRPIAFEPSANFAVPLRTFETQVRSQLYKPHQQEL
jgi:protein-tyrosine phosphatase